MLRLLFQKPLLRKSEALGSTENVENVTSSPGLETGSLSEFLPSCGSKTSRLMQILQVHRRFDALRLQRMFPCVARGCSCQAKSLLSSCRRLLPRSSCLKQHLRGRWKHRLCSIVFGARIFTAERSWGGVSAPRAAQGGWEASFCLLAGFAASFLLPLWAHPASSGLAALVPVTAA